MYYVVHKFPNLLRVVIDLGTHAHPIVDNKCRKSFHEMKNMVIDEVCCMPTAITLAIILFVNKTFIFCHLFNEDGKGLVELLKGEKLDQMLLKFFPLCSNAIHDLIASLKHCPSNSDSIDYILKLKALFSYDYVLNNYFPSQQGGLKVYLFKMSINVATFRFDLVRWLQLGDDLQNGTRNPTVNMVDKKWICFFHWIQFLDIHQAIDRTKVPWSTQNPLLWIQKKPHLW